MDEGIVIFRLRSRISPQQDVLSKIRKASDQLHLVPDWMQKIWSTFVH